MHVADAFAAPDPAAVVSLVRANPFAAVVSVAAGEHGPVPEATHVPVVLEPLRVLTATVEALEDLQPQPWDTTGSLEHFRRILPGVQAFTVQVESVRAVFKLGQDEPEDRYRRVHDDVRGRDAALAAAMDASNPGRTAPAGP